MELFLSYALVFVLASIPMVELVAVIAVGIIAGLSAPLVTVCALLGNMATVLLVIFLIDRLKSWWSRKKGGSAKRTERARRLWSKYGLPGLAFLAPVLIGSHIAAIMGISFGASRARVLAWLSGSLLLWGVGTAVLTEYGIGFISPEHTGFLMKMLKPDGE